MGGRQPQSLIAVALAATAGLGALLWAPQLPPWWGLALCLPPLLLLRASWRLPLLAALLGALWGYVQASTVLEGQWPPARHGEDHRLQGRIADLPQRRQADWRFRFEPDAGQPVRGALRVSWYRSPFQADDDLRVGDCWQFDLRLRAPRGAVSPGAFDYERWLFAQRLAGTAYVRGASRCSAARQGGWPLLRSQLDRRLGQWLGGHEALPLVRALVLANRNHIDERRWEVLRITGTSHLLAISGLHVGLVAGALFWLATLLWRRSARLCGWLAAPRAGLLAGTGAAIAYAGLAGFAVPTQRALLMWTVLALALWSGRAARPWHVLALAWLAVLAADPLVLLLPGTWLSFIAVAALIHLSAGRVPGAWPWWLQLPRLQLGLLVAMAPATLLFFDGVSGLAPLVNALAIPLFALLLPALLASVLWAWIGLGEWPLSAMAGVLDAFYRLLAVAADVGQGAWWSAAPGAATLLCAALAAWLLLAPAGLPTRPLALVLLLPLLWPRPALPEGEAEVAVLDVGQGLAVVVRTRQHVLVYDAGPAWPGGFDAGEGIVAPWLRRQGVRRIDRLLLSHPHADHFGGVAALRREFPTARVHGLASVPGSADGGTHDGPCDTRLSWHWDGVDFAVLHPQPGGRWGVNNVSCVLRVAAGETVLLLTGDIEARGERALLRQAAEALRADVVTAPHHGSRTSSTAGLVARSGAGVVLHSAGWRNRFGHPHAEVLERWRLAGARQWRTDRDGSLLLRLSPAGVGPVSGARHRQPALWRSPAIP